MDIFGYEIKRKEPAQTERSFVPPSDDGALDTIKAGGYYGSYLDLEGAAKNESEQIKRYRDISLMADVDAAIDDVVNEAIANLDNEDAVKIDLRNVKISSTVKKSIEQEFENILSLLHFKDKGQDYFRRWYIDGRMYFHKVIDTAKPKQGLTDIRYIDPRKIKKVRNVIKEKEPKTGVEFVKNVEEFFMYNEKGIHMSPNMALSTQVQGLKITKDAICYTPSGLFDVDQQMVLSYLHKAIKPANQLRMMENALVIYRLARAPERRIFYIDVGNLPKLKAEQYLKDIMNRYRNKMVYDVNTGELRDDKKAMSMLEDFWLPRREGGKGTEIQTLPPGANLGQMEDVVYFQKRLYQSLHVPVTRLNSEQGFSLGRSAEITREELRFSKFVDRLRMKFSVLFKDALGKQLVLKGIVAQEELLDIMSKVKFDYVQDGYFTELKESEIITNRVNTVKNMEDMIGVYYSRNFVRKKVLRLSDDDIEQMEKENGEDPILQQQAEQQDAEQEMQQQQAQLQQRKADMEQV